MLRIEGPTLPPESVGQFVPFLIGATLRDVPAIPVSVGQVNTLARPLAASGAFSPPNPSSIPVSDPTALEACPSSGLLQIDNERFRYTSINLNTLTFVGITRGAQGTEWAAHAVGASVYQVPSSALYVVAENPNGHYTSSITTIKLNGAAKAASTAPTHVITLDDTNVFPGKSVVSIRFDLTTVPFEINTTANPAYLALLAQVPEDISPQWELENAYYATRISYVYKTPMLGTITVDAVGLKDDASGTITGTPSALIERPAHVTKLLMREAYQERNAAQYDSSWATTHALQLAAAEDVAWACRFLPMPFAQFRELVGLQGAAELVWDPDKWRYLARQVLANRTPSYTLNDRSLLASPSLAWTPSTDLITTLQVTYGQPPNQRNFTLASAYQDRYGNRPGTLDLPWLAPGGEDRSLPTAIAKGLARYWLSQWEKPRLTGTLTAGWEGIALEHMDIVTLDTDLLDVYGVLATAFEVRGMRHRVDERLIDLLVAETDPWALRLASGYAVLTTASGLYAQSGYAIVSTALSVSDTVAFALTETGVVAGTVRSADTLPLTISDATPTIPESAAKSVIDTVAVVLADATPVIV